ncbi:MAG TPA: hypothetical protein VGO08_02260 [Burkholderiales bacterium]|nr:hypothetical protein [Burkholderiales bacterium]
MSKNQVLHDNSEIDNVVDGFEGVDVRARRRRRGGGHLEKASVKGKE